MDDIKDNEIRIIGQKKTISSASDKSAIAKYFQNQEQKKFWKKWLRIIIGVLILLGLVGYFFISKQKESVSDSVNKENPLVELDSDIQGVFENEVSWQSQTDIIPSDNVGNPEFDIPFVEVMTDTINDIPLKIFVPHNLRPEFYIGDIPKSDKSVLLALQAADIRKDNGEIVGASVLKGKVVGKGVAKKGFVSIIDGKLSIGMAEHTPLFEEAVQNDGDFFRQYPLVHNGMLIENNPKNKSIRRALCEKEKMFFVVESQTLESFHDFAQALVDLKISNAIYIVGSQLACGFVRTTSGELISWGDERLTKKKNISYIIWKLEL